MIESRYAQHPRHRARLATPLAHACWLGLALALAVGAAQARPIEMNTVPWAPFYGPDLKGQGFITAVTRAAFEEAGHNAQIEFMPWARAMLETKQGDRDLLMGAYYSAERADTYAFSDVIYETKVGLVALRDLGVERFDSLRDLTDYTIGYGRGWATTEEFDNADYLDKEAAKNNVLNVRKLYEGRIDMIAMNFDRFRQIAAEQGFDLDKAVFLEPALKESGLYVMVSRALANPQAIVEDFNAGLAQIRSNGRYEEILADFDQGES
jgi:polar amino acid transport system substrate-binding protein